MLSLHQIAVMEEARQALGTAEICPEKEEIAGGWMCFSGVGSWANQACGLGLAGPVTDEELDRLVAFYVSRGVEPRIELCPFADESLTLGLARRGFELREFENVLARELPAGEDLRAVHPHGWPDALELVHVDPEDEIAVRQFVEVSTQGFRPAEEPISDGLLEISMRMVRHPRCDAFLARWQGEAAGGGAMESSAPVACLFGASVGDEYRRRGIQGALMLRRLERARERGCTLGVIHSRPGIPTERNALRLGFFLAYTKVVMAMPGEGLAVSP